MQFVSITPTTTLSQLTKVVGSSNVSNILAINSIARQPNIGAVLASQQVALLFNTPNVSWQKKSSILNTMTADSDIFETAALQGDNAWKVLISSGSFENTLLVPDTIILPGSDSVMGNGEQVSKTVYNTVISQLATEPHQVDPAVFGSWTTMPAVSANGRSSMTATMRAIASTNPYNLPWGQISLYSSLSGTSMDIPAYPQEMSDGVQANYDSMPSLLYQYEEWPLYKSTSSRTNTYNWKLHRDMWSGNHLDGAANQLIRFIEANCYPNYSGAAVTTSKVTLYIGGSIVISGIMTDFKVNWSGPMGQDGWYLTFDLSCTIKSISPTALNYTVVKNKGLIDG